MAQVKKITIIAGGAVIAVLAWVFFGADYDRSVAASTEFVEAAPLAESSEIIGIRDVKTLVNISEKEDVTIEAVADVSGLAFVMTNGGQKPANIEANWTSSLTGPFDLQIGADVVGLEKSFLLNAGESVVLQSFELDKYQTIFELFPGEYTAELSGWNWMNKDFGTFTKEGNFEVYFIRTNLTIGYDMELIKASPNKLLKTEDMVMTSEGTGAGLFEVTDSDPRAISFYTVNNNNGKISSVISTSQFEIWNADHRFPGIVTSATATRQVVDCSAQEPGESKKVDTYHFSKSDWPLAGENGIAKALGSDDAISGTYIIHFTYSTQPCKLDSGEEVPGSNHSLITALEVKQ